MKEIILNLTDKEIITLYTILMCYGDGSCVSEEEDNLRYKVMEKLSEYM